MKTIHYVFILGLLAAVFFVEYDLTRRTELRENLAQKSQQKEVVAAPISEALEPVVINQGQTNEGKNNFVDNSIVIPVHQFKSYLDRHDKLYFEANDMSTGQLLTKAYTLTFNNYWEEMEREYKQEDLYDFISCTYIDFTKSLSRIEANLQTILTQFIW